MSYVFPAAPDGVAAVLAGDMLVGSIAGRAELRTRIA